MARLIAFFGKLDKAGRIAENVALMIVLAGMVIVAFLQIIAREVFDTGVIWANELIRLMVLWLAMVGAVAACRDNRHIRIDLLSHLLPEKAVTAIRIFVDLFAAVVCAVVAWLVWEFIKLEVELEFTVLGDLPVFPAHVIVPLAFALLSYRFGVLVIKQTLELFAGPEEEASS